MNLSVIIPCFNAANTIKHQLIALANQTWMGQWEVIVVDNGSTDLTRAIVEEHMDHFPNLQLVEAAEKRGAAYARNVGASVAKGESLAFCDADDIVAPGWVAAIGEALQAHEFVASRLDVTKLNPAWMQQGLPHPQSKGLIPYRYPAYLPHASGCGLGIRRVIHEAIGGFDETMGLLEDTDYCWRIQLAGKEFFFVENAVIHFRYRQTIAGIYKQSRSFAEYNALIYKKYRTRGMPQLSWKTGLRAWADLFRRLGGVRSRASLIAWIWQFAWRIGRLQGSIKYRVVAF